MDCTDRTPPIAIDTVEFFDWYERACQQAIAASVPLLELDWLVLRLSQLDKLALRLRSNNASTIFARVSLSEFDRQWQQRCIDRVPVQYLAGSTTWRSFELQVTTDVLIPRPETEAIVDLAIEAAVERLDGHWVDLGTGSGAIAIGLAAELAARDADVTVHASDTSVAALTIARENAATCGVAEQIRFHCGSWFEPWVGLEIEFRAIVSNPPYLPAATIDQLAPEVREHEPRLALDGGATGLDCLSVLPDARDREPRLAMDGGQLGLDCLSVLIEQSLQWLEPDGILLLEHEARQGAVLRDRLQERGYRDVRTVRDLAGLDRFAIARAPL